MMLPTTTPTSTLVSNSDGHDLNSKILLSNHPQSSPRLLHSEHQLPNPQLQSEWISSTKTTIENNKNTMNNNRQRKKQTSLLPAPFLSFQVKNADCAVYVGNIPLDERIPCNNCFTSFENESNASDEDNCPCAIELKAFLRDRINAAFKIPIDAIGIRTCRLFSVVTNVYSNSTPSSNTLEEGGNAGATTNNEKLRHHSGRRVHRAACVEFDDPKIAEHTLALKFTSFHFKGQPHNRSSLRMRRWTTEPPQPAPPPPPPPVSSSPRIWSSKQRQPPPPLRSKSVSPRVTIPKRQQLPPPPPPRSKSVSPSVIGRKPLQRRKQLSVTTSINEKASLHEPLPLKGELDSVFDIDFDDASSLCGSESVASIASDGSFSPPCSSCLIHVGNIPANTTSGELREFFIDRMNKAFHGVTPPEIVRIGMRRRSPISNTKSASAAANQTPRIDACVEFQEAQVAFRATQLKNRRWYIKESSDGSVLDEEGTYGSEDMSLGTLGTNDSESPSVKKRKHATPVLEIEVWDPTKYDSQDFFTSTAYQFNVVETNRNCIGQSIYTQTEGNEEHFRQINVSGDCIEKPKNVPSPPLPRKNVLTEAKDSGFLICTNPNKTPRCDHLFTIQPQMGEEMKCLGEIKKARMCHGYVFQGKVCRNGKKKGGSYKRRDAVCDQAKCPYAHIDSFEQLKDPHDILSLLYYVENNDEVEFIPGTGCTPQEYIQRYRTSEAIPSTDRTQPITQTVKPSSQISTQETLRELQANLSAVQQELAATQEQLHKSERERYSLLQRHATYGQADHATANLNSQDLKDTTIRSLQDEVARLRNNLTDTYHKWEASALTAENTKRDYTALQKKYQQHLDEEGKFHTSTELLQLEVIQLKGELKQSRAENQKLMQQQSHQQDHSESPTNHTQLEESWPELVQFDNFLERSIPTLMQMTDGNPDGKTDEQTHLQLLSKVPRQQSLDRNPSSRLLDLSALERAPSSRLLDVPSSRLLDVSALERTPSSRIVDVPALKSTSPRRNRYKGMGDSNSMLPIGLASPKTRRNEVTRGTDEDSLRSEISYLVSCYGNQVSVMNGEAITVTRFLKLSMNTYHGRDIDVALVLTLPKGYPWEGIVEVHSDPRLSNHFGADSQYRKIVSESVAGLLNICRWEAEACQGYPTVLMNIMKAAERWVNNDWKIIQKKNWIAADHESSQDDSNSSSM